LSLSEKQIEVLRKFTETLNRIPGVLGTMLAVGDEVVYYSGIFEHLDRVRWARLSSTLIILARELLLTKKTIYDELLEWLHYSKPISIVIVGYGLIILPLKINVDLTTGEVTPIYISVIYDPKTIPRSYMEYITVTRCLNMLLKLREKEEER